MEDGLFQIRIRLHYVAKHRPSHNGDHLNVHSYCNRQRGPLKAGNQCNVGWRRQMVGVRSRNVRSV